MPTQPKEGLYATDLSPRDEALVKALLGEDELGVVVRAHIHIENSLETYIGRHIARQEQLGRIDYSMKVRLALACGLSDTLKGPLKAIGQLRNKFSHKLDATLSDQDVKELYNTLPPVGRLACENAQNAIMSNRNKAERVKLEDMSPRAKITMFVLALRGLVDIAD